MVGGSRDFHVRRALTARILSRITPGTRIVHELGLAEGNVRVDVAVIDGRLDGYEIKAERDTLHRLSRQAAVYSAVLDRCTLVVSENHLAAAREAVPAWWGLMVASGTVPEIRVRVVRRPRANPSLDPCVLVKLLWRREALSIAMSLPGGTSLANANRDAIHTFLVAAMSLRRLRSAVRESLRKRRGWRLPARGRASRGDSYQRGASIRDFRTSPLRPRNARGDHHQR